MNFSAKIHLINDYLVKTVKTIIKFRRIHDFDQNYSRGGTVPLREKVHFPKTQNSTQNADRGQLHRQSNASGSGNRDKQYWLGWCR